MRTKEQLEARLTRQAVELLSLLANSAKPEGVGYEKASEAGYRLARQVELEAIRYELLNYIEALFNSNTILNREV